jgi:hypothetical protein
MIHKVWITWAVLTLALAGCVSANPASLTATTSPTAAYPANPSATDDTVGTATHLPVDRTVPVITTTSQPATETRVPNSDQFPYIDNRSSGSDLMISFVNAINRKEYVRAYSYWQNGAAQLPPYDQFAQGYANTTSVQLTIGAVTMGVGAGQMYWAVPVVMIATTSSGATQTYVGCYVTHLGQPANYGTPPFVHMDIQSATVKQVANGTDTSGPLASACQSAGMAGEPLPAQPTFAPDDISAQRYLDDLSDPVEVLRSYFNAINRREYVRAYTYWEMNAAASQLPPYDQFAQGYQDTSSVQLTTGQVNSEAGAGQIYFSVPVTLISRTTAGITQNYVGCYRLHLSQPANYGAPPFMPLGIISANLKQTANGSDTSSMMAQACQ